MEMPMELWIDEYLKLELNIYNTYVFVRDPSTSPVQSHQLDSWNEKLLFDSAKTCEITLKICIKSLNQMIQSLNYAIQIW